MKIKSLYIFFDCAQILAMDINRENYELGLPVIEKAGVAHKIDFREGPALPVLDLMVEDVNFSNPLASSLFSLLSCSRLEQI